MSPKIGEHLDLPQKGVRPQIGLGGMQSARNLPRPLARAAIWYRAIPYRGTSLIRKSHPPKTLQKAYAWGSMVVLGGGALSVERGERVTCTCTLEERAQLGRCAVLHRM